MRLGEGRLDHHLTKMKVPLRNSCVGVCAVQSDCQHGVGSGMVDGGVGEPRRKPLHEHSKIHNGFYG